jgi:ficolin
MKCDMDTDGGGWTVILRRRKNINVQVDFNRTLDEYEDGFGNLNTEFWIGLRNIHCLTTRDDVDLLIDLRQTGGSRMTWIYRKFKVDGPSEKYLLHIAEAEGPQDGYDAMATNNGMIFTTVDDDNDGHNNFNCANIVGGGGWWYNSCDAVRLTGSHQRRYLGWHDGISKFIYYQDVDMMIRPKSCQPYNQETDEQCLKK